MSKKYGSRPQSGKNVSSFLKNKLTAKRLEI
jgi:hypothetical protein